MMQLEASPIHKHSWFKTKMRRGLGKHTHALNVRLVGSPDPQTTPNINATENAKAIVVQ